jgi:hypothetical protein
MNTRNIFIVFFVILGMLPAQATAPVWGEPPDGGNASLGDQSGAPQPDIAIPTLSTILDSLNELKRRIGTREEELQLARTEDQKARVLKDLTQLNARVAAISRDFERIATGVSLETFAARPQERLDLREELQEILGPLIKELKGLTAQPREIERLRGDATYFENQIATAKKALKRVQELIAETPDRELQGKLQEVEKDWKQREQQSTGQLAVVNYQLSEELKKKKPFLESFQSLMQMFFKSRGRNFLLAVVAFGLVLLLCRCLYRLLYRFSPLHNADERTFYSRLTDLVYYGLTFAAATGASLLVLYVAGDWVLLSIAFLFLIGMIWTARQTLPRFWTEAKFLLNLGTVRDGERLVYQGIPWKVQALNFSTELLNPQLKGGMLRLPLKDLMGLTSRPYAPEEPWFPCKEKEWVLLADGTLGRVLVQTPEMVELTLLGGSRKTYATAEFLKQNPNNLSAGFRLSITFRLDPRHQSMSAREIPHKLQETLEQELNKGSYAKDLLAVKVEFQDAQPSSLEFAILVNFAGKAARHYDQLTRTIPRIALETCNEEGWVLPFPQLTFYPGSPAETDPSSSPPPKGRKLWGLWR